MTVQARNHHDTFIFLTAYLLSAFGYEFIFFVMTIYVYQINMSALNVGIFAALTLVPRLFAPFYGTIADRYSKTHILAGAAGITGLMIAAMVFIGQMVWIYLFWTLISVFLAFIINVRTALMTEVMSRNRYLGNSMVLSSLNLAKVCAPLLAGLLSTVMSLKWLFCFTGAIYLLVMLFSTRIHLPVHSVERISRGIIGDLKEGLKYIADDPQLKNLISLAFCRALFIGMQTSLFVVYVKTYLAGSDAKYGLFMTVIGIGSIMGSIIGPWLLKRIKYTIVVVAGMSIHYLSFIVLGFLYHYNIALAVVFLSFLVFYITLVSLHSRRDQATRIDIRGRVYGSVTAILTPPAIVSMLLGGYLSNLIGVEKVMAGAGILALTTLYLLISANHSKPYSSSNTLPS